MVHPVNPRCLLLLPLLLLAACQTTASAVATDTPPVVVAPEAHPRDFLADTLPATLTARLKLRLTAGDQRFTAVGALALAYPDTVALEVNGPLGLTMFVLRADADTVVLLDYPHQTYVAAARSELPAQFRGWTELWRLFPLIAPDLVRETRWERAGDTWTGAWGDAAGRHFLLEAAAARGLAAVLFREGEETVGELTVGEADPATRVPRTFVVSAPQLRLEGEVLQVQRDADVQFAPLRIPDSFRRRELPVAAE